MARIPAYRLPPLGANFREELRARTRYLNQQAADVLSANLAKDLRAHNERLAVGIAAPGRVGISSPGGVRPAAPPMSLEEIDALVRRRRLEWQADIFRAIRSPARGGL